MDSILDNRFLNAGFIALLIAYGFERYYLRTDTHGSGGDKRIGRWIFRLTFIGVFALSYFLSGIE